LASTPRAANSVAGGQRGARRLARGLQQRGMREGQDGRAYAARHQHVEVGELRAMKNSGCVASASSASLALASPYQRRGEQVERAMAAMRAQQRRDARRPLVGPNSASEPAVIQ
jgi:hypothetical protein